MLKRKPSFWWWGPWGGRVMGVSSAYQLVTPSPHTITFPGDTSGGVDVNKVGLDCFSLQCVGAFEEAGNSLAGKLQESSDNATWTDLAGGAFAAVTEGDNLQILHVRPTKRYIRYLGTVTGGSADFMLAVQLGVLT